MHQSLHVVSHLQSYSSAMSAKYRGDHRSERAHQTLRVEWMTTLERVITFNAMSQITLTLTQLVRIIILECYFLLPHQSGASTGGAQRPGEQEEQSCVRWKVIWQQADIKAHVS